VSVHGVSAAPILCKILSKSTLYFEYKGKKRPDRRKHCVLAVERQSQKFSARRRPPSRGRGKAKILSAGDGHYLHLQTQFGEDRCTQFRVIVVTDPETHTNPQTKIGPVGD